MIRAGTSSSWTWMRNAADGRRWRQGETLRAWVSARKHGPLRPQTVSKMTNRRRTYSANRASTTAASSRFSLGEQQQLMRAATAESYMAGAARNVDSSQLMPTMHRVQKQAVSLMTGETLAQSPRDAKRFSQENSDLRGSASQSETSTNSVQPEARNCSVCANSFDAESATQTWWPHPPSTASTPARSSP